MKRCACGLKMRVIDGVVYVVHTQQDHFARLNRGKGKKPQRDRDGLAGNMSEAAVRRALKERLAALEQEGAVE